jgi:flagellar export protein FliJ
VRGFTFRAQAALDLRQREDEAAQRALAKADAELRAAATALREAIVRGEDARTQCANAIAAPGGLALQQWYRSWIMRLDRERDACASAVAAREKARTRAAAERARTHQRVEALERFKEKAVRAWERRAAAEEQKHLDALGTLRFFTDRRQRSRESGANG